MIEAVVFDLGQVLSSPPDLLPRLAARIGVPPGHLGAHYGTDRLAYDAGSDAAAYWGPILEALDRAPDDDTVTALAELDALISMELRDDALAILRDCAAADVTVALLTNASHALEPAIAAADWRRHLDHVFVSATIGLLKPDEALYRHVTDALGVAPERIAFIDDKPANVDGALRVGWTDTRAWLTRLGVLDQLDD